MRSTILTLALFTLAACDGKSDDTGSTTDGGSTDGGATDGGSADGGAGDGGGEADTDGDGYVDSEDCDPENAEINPGATELCDEVDNDCDGETDEDDAEDATTWYVDADEDGYGDDADPGTTTCTQPSGTVANNLDCYDDIATINPDATETCNSLDDNCDGEVDEAGAFGEGTWYVDADGDGYGDASVTEVSCHTPTGYVDDDTDCDDTEPTVNPGEDEICNDGLDNDCDGTGAGCVLEGTVSSSDASETVTGSGASDRLGASISSAGDTNGDGVDDLVVGATYADEGGTRSSGSAYLYLGSTSGLDTTASATMSGEKVSDLFGWMVDAAGDSNDDGYDDVLVTTYAASSSTGASYVFRGPLSGNTVASAADAIFKATSSSTYFGWRAVGAGDVDGDGTDDVMITAPATSSNTGVAYVFMGTLSGSYGPTDADATLTGVKSGDWTGGAASAPGDLDGDGLDDLAISAEEHDVTYTNDGQVYLWFGTLSGSLDLADADVTITGVAASGALGWEEWGAGDSNDDGYLDFAISSPTITSNTGGGWLFLGPLSSGTWSASLADATFEGLSTGEYFGQAVRGEGDVDGDGNDDLAFTATSGSSGAGAAHLFYGPMTGSYDSSDADFTVEGASGSDILGTSVTIAGDYNADGYNDFAVGAVGVSTGGSYAGAWYLFYSGDL